MKTKKLNKAQLAGLIKEELAKLKKKRNINEGRNNMELTFVGGSYEVENTEYVEYHHREIGGWMEFSCPEIPGLIIEVGFNGVEDSIGDLVEFNDFTSDYRITANGKTVEF